MILLLQLLQWLLNTALYTHIHTYLDMQQYCSMQRNDLFFLHIHTIFVVLISIIEIQNFCVVLYRHVANAVANNQHPMSYILIHMPTYNGIKGFGRLPDYFNEHLTNIHYFVNFYYRFVLALTMLQHLPLQNLCK